MVTIPTARMARQETNRRMRIEKASVDGGKSVSPVIRQVRFAVAQDFEDRRSIARRQVRELFAGLFTRQDIEEPAQDAVFDFRRELVERFAVDQVTARIFEQPRLQIELPQGTALRVERSARGEFFGEAGRP